MKKDVSLHYQKTNKMENELKGKYTLSFNEDQIILMLNAITEYNTHSIRRNMFKKEYLDECLDLEEQLGVEYSKIYKQI